MAHEKPSLRRALRECRRGVRPSARRNGALRVARRGRLLLRHAKRVGAYLPHGSEIDPRPLMYALARSGCVVYLPIVSKQPNSPLVFRPWRSSLARNTHGIMEPRWGLKLQGVQLDAVLVPLLGFDLRGSRLGQGGGHYDRTFAFLSRKKHIKPHLIGVAFECQRVAKLPNDPHDVRLHAILTEKRVYRTRRRL
ncbi:MAG TPA: 5-formyltetrahydrofolate cyclo-ligase [Acidiferrobacter sp.]|nr:5-formyltetrahydrofolate cyclo-ligase [Acidiferrobacter sp.]